MEQQLLVDGSRRRLFKVGHARVAGFFLLFGKRLWSPENRFLAYNTCCEEELFLAPSRPILIETEGAISFIASNESCVR
jgi:hypothetical protein